MRINCARNVVRGIKPMKFKENQHYDLFGYDVELIGDHRVENQWFKVSKGNDSYRIDMAIDPNFLKDMDSTETRRLELLFRDLENYAKFGDSEE